MEMINRLCVAVVFGALVACGPAQGPATGQPADQFAGEFEGGTGQQGTDTTSAYAGPYGVGVGSVIPNYKFLGYQRPAVARTELGSMHLSDFYNPTGTDVYPPGSPYGEGTAKPKALYIVRSAVWCDPCNYEAANELPKKHAKYFPGGELMVALDEGPTPGIPALQDHLTKWVTKYKIDYPAVLNPAATLSAIVGIDAYPGHIIVRTRDMKIIAWVAGMGDDAFWKLYDDTLKGKPVLPED